MTNATHITLDRRHCTARNVRVGEVVVLLVASAATLCGDGRALTDDELTSLGAVLAFDEASATPGEEAQRA